VAPAGGAEPWHAATDGAQPVNRSALRTLMVVIGLLTGACAPSLEAARVSGKPALAAAQATQDRSRCERLDRTYRRGAVVAAVFGGVATGAGAGMIPSSEDPVKEDRRRVALGAVAIGSGAIVAGATVSSTLAAQRWARECAP
jgi:hypothetical protein